MHFYSNGKTTVDCYWYFDIVKGLATPHCKQICPFDWNRKELSILILLHAKQKPRLTDDMNISKLCFCCDRVDLTHVSSVIFFFDIVYMQKPCSMLIVLIMCYTNARISSDYMIVNGQDCTLFKMDPCHLHEIQSKWAEKTECINDFVLTNRFVEMIMWYVIWYGRNCQTNKTL